MILKDHDKTSKWVFVVVVVLKGGIRAMSAGQRQYKN